MENNYQENPVEGFGKKILSKQGWFQGRGIGKLSSGEITPFSNYTGRGERSGLGSDKEFIKKQKFELKLGDSVEITKGKHQGLIGTLLQTEEESAIIEIKDNLKSIKVPITLLVKTEKKTVEEVKNDKKVLKWVVPDLIVRIRSKFVYKGQIYGCKGKVEDVIDQYRFTVKVNGKIYEELVERDLETVIPAVGKSVRVVRGENMGEICTLIARDKKRNVVTLQLPGEVIFLKQDDVCEYIHDD